MAKYKVAVIGLLLSNGKMAKYGDEITDEQITDVEKRVTEGYLKKSSDFDKEVKSGDADLDDDAKKEKAANDAAAAKAALLKQYEEAFLVPAPADADDKAIAKAVKDGKAIAAK